MKKILLLSDTHSHIDERILHFVKQADEVWHAGDIGDLKVTQALALLKPLKAVYGNIDDANARLTYPLDLKFECEGMSVWMTHIGGYPGKYNQRIREDIKQAPPDIFIAGHSHILKVQWDKNLQLMHMNPGACGLIGFHQIRTMLSFKIDGAEIKDLVVIELGKRGEIIK
ncbi:MAG: metallophosphoesterase family protein [Flavobacteriaceae bacterium]|mgnify:FL=1|jgi:putative phosphoesterase|tara:strand:- start:2990 stop:3499 length:510 start_codon:yes stop_codon:yes gene_type:complete